MSRNREIDPYELLAQGGLCLAVILIVWFFVQSVQSGAPQPAPQTQRASEDPRRKSFCGEVLQGCEVVIDEKVADCAEDKARQKVQDVLSDSLRSKQCQQAESELSRACPEGCLPDRNDMMIIPGRLIYEFDGKPDESGSCSVKATKPVTLKVGCYKTP